jgi:hypothetical protein
MHKDALQAGLLGRAQNRIQVFLMRVNAAIGDQTDQMQGATRLAGVLEAGLDLFVVLERVVGHHAVNARNVHLHNAARANVQVAHFAVAHLPARQTDKLFRCLDQRVGIFAQKRVVGGLCGQCNGVVFSLRTISPSIEDGEHYRTLGSHSQR